MSGRMPSEDPKSWAPIAVVVPAHNAGKTISAALTSVLQQVPGPREVVVVDDGSTDNTASIVRSFWPRVRLIQQPNSGVSAARNAGIAATASEWIAFLDADDEWYPNKLASQLALANATPCAVLIAGTARYIDSRERLLHTGRAAGAGALFPRLIRGNIIVTSSVLVRRSALNVAGGWFRQDLSLGEDWELWLRLSARGEFVLAREPVVKYRVASSGRYSSDTIQRSYQIILAALREDVRAKEALSPRAIRRYVSGLHFAVARQLILEGRPREAIRRSIIGGACDPSNVVAAAKVVLHGTRVASRLGRAWMRAKLQWG